MIDLHTHILPGIDDGAEDEEVSAKLLDALVSQGVSKIVFTSHYYGRKRSPRQYLEARAAAFAQIKNLIPADVEIFLGAEVHFTKQMAAANDSLCSLAIGDTRYILLELPFNAPWDRGLWNRLGDFISDTDYIPVIAHVERYKEVWKKPVLLSVLKDMGCLLQVNTGAFLDGDSKKLAPALWGIIWWTAWERTLTIWTPARPITRRRKERSRKRALEKTLPGFRRICGSC